MSDNQKVNIELDVPMDYYLQVKGLAEEIGVSVETIISALLSDALGCDMQEDNE